MKKQIVMAVCLLLLSFLFSSCGNNKLTKDEAKKQIDEYLNKIKPPSIGLGDDVPVPCAIDGCIALLDAVKKDGYIDWTITTDYYHFTHRIISLTSKATPFMLSNQGSFTIKAGTYSAKIISITEPGSDLEGKVVSNVEYSVEFTPNDIYKSFTAVATGKDHGALCIYFDINHNQNTNKAIFTKMQDGWKMESK